MAKQWIAPKEFHYKELNAKNCVPSDAKEHIRITEVKSKNQVHQNYVTPVEYNEQGKCTVQFDAAMTGSINASVGDDGISTSYSFWMEIYAGYNRIYLDLNRVADSLLARVVPTSTPDQIQLQLVDALAKHGIAEDEVRRVISENLPRGREFGPDHFRQTVLACLLPAQLARDPEGSALMKFCVDLKRNYCAWLDAHVIIKEQIYGAVKIDDKMVDQPTAELFNDVFKWTTHDKSHASLANKIDYSKSPAISFKMLSSVAKPGQKTQGKIRISEANEVMWTVVYDYINRSLADAGKPIATLDEFLFFTYTKGDSKRAENPRPAFRLTQEVKTLEPTVFWGELTKRGQFQFKVIETHITKKMEFGGGSRALSADDVARRFSAARRLHALHDMDQQQQEEAHDYANYDDHAGDKRGTAEADDTRDTKKPRLFEPLETVS